MSYTVYRCTPQWTSVSPSGELEVHCPDTPVFHSRFKWIARLWARWKQWPIDKAGLDVMYVAMEDI